MSENHAHPRNYSPASRCSHLDNHSSDGLLLIRQSVTTEDRTPDAAQRTACRRSDRKHFLEKEGSINANKDDEKDEHTWLHIWCEFRRSFSTIAYLNFIKATLTKRGTLLSDTANFFDLLSLALLSLHNSTFKLIIGSRIRDCLVADNQAIHLRLLSLFNRSLVFKLSLSMLSTELRQDERSIRGFRRERWGDEQRKGIRTVVSQILQTKQLKRVITMPATIYIHNLCIRSSGTKYLPTPERHTKAAITNNNTFRTLMLSPQYVRLRG